MCFIILCFTCVYMLIYIFLAWDQSDKFLKIYVTLNGVHTLPKENIQCEFGPK